MRCNEPDMSERVFQSASPVTIKLILNRLDNLGAGIDGLANSLSTSSIYIICRPTDEPPNDCGLQNGLSLPQSSAIMTWESAIRISACPVLLPGASIPNIS